MRRTWRRRQASFDPARLIFLDESGAKTNMTRLCGRAPKGERVHAKAPQGHWHTTTILGSLRLDGSTACMTVEGAADAEVFQAYVRHVLCPTLRPGESRAAPANCSTALSRSTMVSFIPTAIAPLGGGLMFFSPEYHGKWL